MYIYQYDENTLFFKVSTFPYKGIEYKWKDYCVVVNDKEYSIINVEQNNLNKYEIWLWRSREDCPRIKGNKDVIDTTIERIITLKSNIEQQTPVYDHPDAVTLGSGCLWYIIIMIGGLIFKDWLIIWVTSSIIFWPWFFNKPRFKQ